MERPEGLDDPKRLAAVRRTELMDSPREAAFDRIAQLAATLLEVPYAFVSITDDTRSYWKAQVGMGDDVPQGPPVEASFCQYVVSSARDELLVDDATQDALTRDNPSVTEVGVRAWAGAAVRTRDSQVIGSLCVADTSPRTWTERDAEILRSLAEATSAQVALLESLVAEREAREEAVGLARALETILLPVILPDLPGIEIAAHHRSEAATGGALLSAFYDVFAAADGARYAIVGEVSAEGPDAAAATGLTRFSARSAATFASGPAEILALVDETLGHQAPDGVVASAAIVGVRRASAGRIELRVASAGRASVIHFGADGAVEALPGPGPVLGRREPASIDERRMMLAPGESLVISASRPEDLRPPAPGATASEIAWAATTGHDVAAALAIRPAG